ncbi:MAG: hypothetical protein H6Q18_688 [Bacteroidetes bacterium]|nr:hypothetical protein [Bacteroidota bacterium]
MWMEILKYTIPALLVILVSYLLLYQLFRNETERRNFELKKANLSTITPIKLRAYERLMLLMERIHPISLLLNKVEAGMSCVELHGILLNDIRREFEHNASQQIYVSNELWEDIKNAYENLIQLINTCASQCNAEEPASKLATMIIKIYETADETALDVAKQALKNEVKEIL